MITDNTVASVKITAIDNTIENDLKLSIENGAFEAVNGYQLVTKILLLLYYIHVLSLQCQRFIGHV